MTDELYARTWRKRHSLNERNLYNYLYKEFNLELDRYIQTLDDTEPRDFHITFMFGRVWITELLKEAYSVYGVRQNDFMNGLVTKDVEESDFLLAYAIYLADYFRRSENLFISLGIIESYKDEIKDFVDKNLMLPKSALITKLTIFLRGLNMRKALTISRTEITRIMNSASEIWAKLNPKIKKKQWIVILDGKERSTHGAMASYPPIGLDEKFVVGGYLMDKPGDATAPPQEVINCRCALKFLN